jgi:hypothetical protein|tara:strand:- start:185 stop:673 length:489 start_codon:yes stop_codon:yes gene_type:complete
MERFKLNPYTGSPMYYKDNPEAVKKRDAQRMYVNGKEISKKHPLHKPGRYKSLDDVWSHSKIESIDEGEVYIVCNSAWPDWVKVGKAVNAEDRLNGYQTSSPFRDYEVVATLSTGNRHKKEREMHKIFQHFAQDRKGEWFKIDKVTAIKLFNYQIKGEEIEA